MLIRFVIGSVATVGLAFSTFILLTAIRVWSRGGYPFGGSLFDEWLKTFSAAGGGAIFVWIAFALSFPLLDRRMRDRGFPGFLLTIVIPFAMFWVLCTVLVLFTSRETMAKNFLKVALIGILVFLSVILFATLWHRRRTRKIATSEGDEEVESAP
jgi:hypothetical protein